MHVISCIPLSKSYLISDSLGFNMFVFFLWIWFDFFFFIFLSCFGFGFYFILCWCDGFLFSLFIFSFLLLVVVAINRNWVLYYLVKLICYWSAVVLVFVLSPPLPVVWPHGHSALCDVTNPPMHHFMVWLTPSVRLVLFVSIIVCLCSLKVLEKIFSNWLRTFQE